MRAVALPGNEPGLSALARKPVSDVKREGWRGVMKSVDVAGKLLMTNHDRPEAVILSLPEFARLSALAERVQSADQRQLQTLQQAFDQELAVLKSADAGERLRQAFGRGPALNEQLAAGGQF